MTERKREKRILDNKKQICALLTAKFRQEQAAIAVRVRRELDCGVDKRIRSLLREQWMLKELIKEERE